MRPSSLKVVIKRAKLLIMMNYKYRFLYFPIGGAGLRQGDPLANYLFLVVQEILANHIRPRKRLCL